MFSRLRAWERQLFCTHQPTHARDEIHHINERLEPSDDEAISAQSGADSAQESEDDSSDTTSFDSDSSAATNLSHPVPVVHLPLLVQTGNQDMGQQIVAALTAIATASQQQQRPEDPGPDVN